MANIKNKNELKRRIDLFLDEFTSEEYKINEEFCKETMKMMREFIGHTDNRINVLIAKKEKKDRKIRELQEQNKWHLCEDGDLPTRYDDYYLCQLKGSRNYGGNIQVCKYRKADRFKEHDYFDHMRNGFPNVIAWRELPKFEREV